MLDTVTLARDARIVQVPFSIALPADAEVSGWPDERSEIDWTLSLRAPMAGPLVIVALACLLALVDGNPVVSRYHLGLSDWGGWVLAVVLVLNIVGTMLVATGIDVDGDAVRIRRGPFGIGPPKRLRRRDVAQIRPKPSSLHASLLRDRVRHRERGLRAGGRDAHRRGRGATAGRGAERGGAVESTTACPPHPSSWPDTGSPTASTRASSS